MCEKQYDVIGIANPILDLILEMDQLPSTNTNGKMSNFCYQGGGNVTTALVACSVLGMRTAILGVTGDDIMGKAIRHDFEYNAVDTSRLIEDPGKRSHFCICITEHAISSKKFISKPGSCRQIEQEDVQEDFIRSARMLHIGGFSPAIIRACNILHSTGGKVSIDAAYFRPDIYENLRYLDIFIGSETYFNTLCAETGCERNCECVMREIQRQGPEIVLFTFGDQGCQGLYGDKYFELPAFSVPVVDTTGAGDVFHGAFDYAYLQGWDVETCARFASGEAAIKCTRLGGRAGIANLSTLTKFLEEGAIDSADLDKRVARYQQGFF